MFWHAQPLQIRVCWEYNHTIIILKQHIKILIFMKFLRKPLNYGDPVLFKEKSEKHAVSRIWRGILSSFWVYRSLFAHFCAKCEKNFFFALSAKMRKEWPIYSETKQYSASDPGYGVFFWFFLKKYWISIVQRFP